MAVLGSITQTSLHSTQYSADWIIVETAGMQTHHITMQQLEPSCISALEISISAAASRLGSVMAAMGVLSLMRCCVCVFAKWTYSSGSVKYAAVDARSLSITPENNHWYGADRETSLSCSQDSGPQCNS